MTWIELGAALCRGIIPYLSEMAAVPFHACLYTSPAIPNSQLTSAGTSGIHSTNLKRMQKGGERFTCEQAVNTSWSWTQVLGSIACRVSAKSAKINWNPLHTQQWQLDLLANLANSFRMEKSVGLHIIIYHIWSNLLLTAPTNNNHRTHVIQQSYRHFSSSFFLFHLDEINEGTKPTKLQ